MAVTTRVLTNMKNVKMLGLANHMAGMMEALRTAELNISLALRRWLTMAVGLCKPRILIPVCTKPED